MTLMHITEPALFNRSIRLLSNEQCAPATKEQGETERETNLQLLNSVAYRCWMEQRQQQLCKCGSRRPVVPVRPSRWKSSD